MHKIIEWCKETCEVGLKFVPLDMDTIRIVLFTDSSFANAEHSKSQLGFVVVLADGDNNANIVHFGSMACKRVARSVMAAELHSLIYGFDQAFVTGDMLQELLGRKVHIDAYVDSRTVFNVVAKTAATLKKRIQLDVHALRESHTNGELRNIEWIPGTQKVSDGLTKGIINSDHPLWQLMVSNKLRIKATGWVRNNISSATQANQKTSER